MVFCCPSFKGRAGHRPFSVVQQGLFCCPCAALYTRHHFRVPIGGENPLKQQIIPAGQGQDYDWANDHIYVKTSAALTNGRVTLVEDTLKPGFHLPRHHHRQMTEIFYILAGEAVFKFYDETITATPGMTLNIPPYVWHDVTAPKGATLLTIFTPGGFDAYLQVLDSHPEQDFADAELMNDLAEKYDTWVR